MYCASSVHLSGSRPYFVSSPLVLTCTKTGSGGLPKFSTALFSLLASCRPRQLLADSPNKKHLHAPLVCPRASPCTINFH